MKLCYIRYLYRLTKILVSKKVKRASFSQDLFLILLCLLAVAELAKILEVDTKKVKDAVSLYCRLGFAKKKNRFVT